VHETGCRQSSRTGFHKKRPGSAASFHPPPPRLPPARPSVRPSSLLDPAARSRGLPPPRKYFECTSTSRDFPPRPLALPPLPRPSVLLSAGENKIPPKKGRERKEEKRNCRAKKCAGMHFEGICSGPGPGPVWKSGMENEGISPEISLPPPPPPPLSLSLSPRLSRVQENCPRAVPANSWKREEEIELDHRELGINYAIDEEEKTLAHRQELGDEAHNGPFCSARWSHSSALRRRRSFVALTGFFESDCAPRSVACACATNAQSGESEAGTIISFRVLRVVWKGRKRRSY